MKNLQIMNMSRKKYLILTIMLLLFPIRNINAATTGTCFCNADFRPDPSRTNKLQIVSCSEECSKEYINSVSCKANSLKIEFKCKKADMGTGSTGTEYTGIGFTAISACESVIKQFSVPSQGVGFYHVSWEVECIAPPTEKNTIAHEQVGSNFCSEPDVLKVIRLLGYILLGSKFLVPFILIVVGTFDYYKAVIASDDKSLSNQTKILGKRLIISIIIFFIPNILNASLNLIGSWKEVEPEYLKCSSCLLGPNSCVIPETPTRPSNNSATTTSSKEYGGSSGKF